MWRKENLHRLLEGMETGASMMEKSMKLPQKMKNGIVLGSCNPTSQYVSKGNEISISKI